MNRRRTNSRTLTGTRIYVRSGKFYYFAPEPMLNPKTGKVRQWHILCAESEGEFKAREALNTLLGTVNEPKGDGDFSIWFGKWRTILLQQRDTIAPTDPVRLAIWQKGSKALISVLAVIENAFAEFDVAQVRPYDIGQFLEQWEGRRSAQAYRAHLSKFFEWCIHKRGLVDVNPARQISVPAPPKRDVYFSDEQYRAIHTAIALGEDDKPTHDGMMAQGYMDLLYLFYQRGTDVRLLRKDQVSQSSILFKPTKTERSSGAKVQVPIGEDAQIVIASLKSIGKMRSLYLLHDQYGQPYTAEDMGKLFRKACRRSKITGVTLKDIRAKAATDAKRQGYKNEQVQTALAHTDGATTRDYIRSREVPISEVILKLPK